MDGAYNGGSRFRGGSASAGGQSGYFESGHIGSSNSVDQVDMSVARGQQQLQQTSFNRQQGGSNSNSGSFSDAHFNSIQGGGQGYGDAGQDQRYV